MSDVINEIQMYIDNKSKEREVCVEFLVEENP
jgi:hypothetical protein